MAEKYIVNQGDCLSSIAAERGLFWQTIWNDPANSRLKSKRKDPNVLCPGDVVMLHDKRPKSAPAATDRRHRFCRKGVPEKLLLQIIEDGQPRANESYTLDIDGALIQGVTDAEGRVEEAIPPNAKKARLLLGNEQTEYRLDLGHLDPIDLLSGVQARLNSLGYDCGVADGTPGPRTEAALKRFQQEHSLTESGTADQQTQQKLREVYGR